MRVFSTVLALCLLALANPALAERMYVVDELIITIRQNRSISGNVVGRAKSLDKVEVLEGDENWAKVRTEDGTTGWVQKRYLTETMPEALRLKNVQEENAHLAETVQTLEQENQRLKSLSDDLEKKLANEKAVLSKLETDYRELGENAADYLVIKKEYEESRNQLTAVKAEAEELRRASNESINSRRIKWFITGGVVLLAGWLVGIISARRKKVQSRIY